MGGVGWWQAVLRGRHYRRPRGLALPQRLFSLKL